MPSKLAYNNQGVVMFHPKIIALNALIWGHPQTQAHRESADRRSEENRSGFVKLARTDWSKP
jgi:hypothetical protein